MFTATAVPQLMAKCSLLALAAV